METSRNEGDESREWCVLVLFVLSHTPDSLVPPLPLPISPLGTLPAILPQALVRGQQARMLNVHEYISMDIMKSYGINTPQVCLLFAAFPVGGGEDWGSEQEVFGWKKDIRPWTR